ENLIVRDVFDLARRECNCHRVAVCGASLGAYHAANIAFRHPDTVSHLISLSGSFDISSFFDGYHDDNIYFNSPYEYLPNMSDPWKYNHMGIIIGTGEWDNTRHESYRLSEILNSKGIKHWLDDGKWRGHEWSYWRDMLPYYLSVLGYLCVNETGDRRNWGKRSHLSAKVACADRLCCARGPSGHERACR